MYRRVMLEGCRSVEIDLWDTHDHSGEPDVTHGMTACTRCKLRAVLEALVETAFVVSELPVWLSLENHCNRVHQIRTASMFREIFGPALVLPDEVERLHEQGELKPTSLKRRFLLKGKMPKPLANALVDDERGRAPALAEANAVRLEDLHFPRLSHGDDDDKIDPVDDEVRGWSSVAPRLRPRGAPNKTNETNDRVPLQKFVRITAAQKQSYDRLRLTFAY